MGLKWLLFIFDFMNHYNPGQPRDKTGKWTDGFPGHIKARVEANQRIESGVVDQMEVDAMMNRAREAGPEVDRLANEIAHNHGGIVTPMNYKSRESIIRKARDEYGGDVTKVKDAARTTIIVENDSDVEGVLQDFEKRYGGNVRIKRQKPDDFLGYSGSIMNFTAPNGLVCEIQVNTPRMIYAKDPYAEQLLGPNRFNEVRSKYGQPPGRGHEYYERYRVLKDPNPPNDKKRMEIEEESKKYYSSFR